MMPITTTTTTTTTEKTEDQEQPIHWIPVKEEESPTFKTPQKRVSFDLIPFYINGDSSRMADSSSMSTKQGKENMAAFHDLLGRRKRSSPSPVKGAGILKNTNNSRCHRRRYRHNNTRQSENNDNDNNVANSSNQPRLILRGPKNPRDCLVKFKFDGRIIRTVNMEKAMC
ncbi:uncharacterized protein TRUGW13939_03793 [Talaromyces rugulosus]|uniref:Uncharacterized protein n=1 Tax=Talaromyces rugulosus TaxID=121627 RepID=A0A7H8QRS3_TALRU|nr:uncharacterized protein TRUGW13939_03793 [Talaromyces rugulosus]QKX56687.1 hypothetical protein TRUGW13939_03793 [Talaromyces rugulosus]